MGEGQLAAPQLTPPPSFSLCSCCPITAFCDTAPKPADGFSVCLQAAVSPSLGSEEPLSLGAGEPEGLPAGKRPGHGAAGIWEEGFV